MRPHCLKPTKSALWHLRMHYLLCIEPFVRVDVRVEQQVGGSWSWTWGFGRRRFVESPHWRRGRGSIRSKKRCKVCSSPLAFLYFSHLLLIACLSVREMDMESSAFVMSIRYCAVCAQMRLYMFRGSSPHHLKVIRPKSLSLCCASQCHIPWSCPRYRSLAKLYWSTIRSASYPRRG